LTEALIVSKLDGMSSLPSQIDGLSDAEKFDLIDALWQDLERHASALSAEQTEELDRRIGEYEAHPPVGRSWEEVRAGLPRR
jgi:putative addiction module component (TIGR02574 family)